MAEHLRPPWAHVSHVLHSLQQRRAHSVVAVDDNGGEGGGESGGAESGGGKNAGGRALTGAQLAAEVACLARGLESPLCGVGVGERVCIAALNSTAYVEWLLAVPAMGAILAPLNHRWSEGEAALAVQQVGAAVLVVDAAMRPWWNALVKRCPSLRLGVLIGDGDARGIPSPAMPNTRESAAGAPALLPMAAILQAGREVIMQGDASPGNTLPSLCSPAHSSFLHHIPLRSSPHQVAVLCFTSGTTGSPKAAALSHTALITQSLAKLACAGYRDSDTFLHVAPLCHIGGISSLLAMLMACGRNILVPRFLPHHLPALLTRHSVTALIAVPAMLTDLLLMCSQPRQSQQPGASFPMVRTVLVGGGAMTPSLQQQVEGLFPSARLMIAYGMTEAASSMTFATLRTPPHARTTLARTQTETLQQNRPPPAVPSIGEDRHPDLPSSACCVGFPAPHVEIQILPLTPQDPPLHHHGPRSSPSSSTHLTPDPLPPPSAHAVRPVVGEVLTRGPHVMGGYWGRAEETSAVLSSDGWLNTGDMGWIDPRGQLWLVGRRKEMIKTGGENVFCAEVEGAVRAHPAVAAVAAAGVPDERLGEAVAVLLVLKPGWVWETSETPAAGRDGSSSRGGSGFVGKKLTLSDLHASCTQHGLSRYKFPRVVVVLPEGQQLPVTALGKVKRVAVRDAIVQALQSSSGPGLRARL